VFFSVTKNYYGSVDPALWEGSFSAVRPGRVLRGRDRELAALRELLSGAAHGHGAAIVVTAEPGMGRTALLHALCREAAGFRIAGTAGTDAESALATAGLHRLLQRLPAQGLPAPHAQMLARVGNGCRSEPGDGFLLCCAVHRALIEAARQQPVLCWADDAHLLDRASAEALAFTARRVGGHPVAVIVTRQLRAGPGRDRDPFLDLPRMQLTRLDDDASQAVLHDWVPAGIPPDLCAGLVELASGNPLALTELAASLTPEQCYGAAPGPSSLPAHSRLRATITRRFHQLSADARRLVMMAVAGERLDVNAVLRAAVEVGLDLRALEEAKESGLVAQDGEQIAPRSRLVGAVLHAGAPLAERRAAHQLLAAVLDPGRDGVRRAWHLAAAAGVPSAQVAGEMSRSAEAMRRSGAYAASSATDERAAALTPSPEAKARRLVLAAADAWLDGQTRRSRALLDQALPLPAGPGVRGLAGLQLGRLELHGGVPAMASQVLLAAAGQLGDHSRAHAVTALVLAGEASCLAGDHAACSAIAARAHELRRPGEPPAVRVMFDYLAGMAATYEGNHAAATRPLRRAVRAAGAIDDVTAKILASHAAYALGDTSSCLQLATQAVSGALSRNLPALLPWARRFLSLSALLLDKHSMAVASSLDGLREAQATGQQNFAAGHLSILALLAALQGDRTTTVMRMDAAAGWLAARGLSQPGTLGSWALACADLAADRPADALARLRFATAGTSPMHLPIKVMAVPHFVEAAARCGRRDAAARALRTYDRWVGGSGCAPRLALSHRCHALLAGSKGEADEHFREAIRLHDSTGAAFELAKTKMFYGYELRRNRKPAAARELLRDAVKIFQDYEADPWARRASAELRASGEAVPPGSVRPAGELTPQQMQISRLVAEGATNREIACQLFISPRTVDYHLRNIFAKLGVRSRVELATLFR
jgi:DNA-binding CsgD family transcriptional regulator/tetratricopeptide (TPR) repeat protein